MKEEYLKVCNMNHKQADAVRASFEKLWDAVNWLSKEVLTVNQMEQFSEYLNRDKEKEAEEKAKKFDDLCSKMFAKTDPLPTAENLKCDWPSQGIPAAGDGLS